MTRPKDQKNERRVPARLYAAAGLVFLSIACAQVVTDRERTVADSDYVAQSDGGAEDVHADILRTDKYPSARTCAPCHQNIYDEWRSSAHAYSGMSPMFHKFEQTLNGLASGTVGAFCVRCHLPVGTELGQPREMTLYDREQDFERFENPYVSVEGVTCIACHRVAERYGRVNGQRRIEPGTAFEPMFGYDEDYTEEYGDGVAKDGYEVALEKGGDTIARDEEEFASGEGRSKIHGGVRSMPALARSEFCMSCHQVAVHPGIKLEVVWDQYLDSPAHDEGATCQDCHMGRSPGEWFPRANFDAAPRAKVNTFDEIYLPGDEVEIVTNPDADPSEFQYETVRGIPHKDHSFVGPGYSIAHPGIFPHTSSPVTRVDREDAVPITIADWMIFPWDGTEWGTSELENDLGPSLDEEALRRGTVTVGALDGEGTREVSIPDAWCEFDGSGDLVRPDNPWLHKGNRERARLHIQANLEELAKRKIRRESVMAKASHIDGPFFALSEGEQPRAGRSLSFRYEVRNDCSGHNLPSGSLGAQPQVWLNVSVVNESGELVWESGYVDDVGDIADLHSKQVLGGDLPHDDQLFNLQSKFLTTNVKGTDREMYLPVNIDVDQIPFIRPAGVPSTVLNHPPFIRMEQRSIPPLMTRDASYTIPGDALSEPGTYTMSVRLRSRAEPIYFMEFVGATPEMIDRMNERMVDTHFYSVDFEVQ